MKKKMFLVSFLVTLLVSINAFSAEEVKLISYYPAPYGAYKEVQIGSSNDYIKIYDSNGSSFANGSEILSSDNLVRIKGILNVYAASGNVHQIKVGNAVKYNLVSYNPGGSGMKIADENISGPVQIMQAVGIPTSYVGSAFVVEAKTLPDASSITTGIRVDHYLTSDSTIYGIDIQGQNNGAGNFYAGRFGGDIKVTGRATLGKANIPVVLSPPSVTGALEGDIVYNKGTSKLMIFVNGAWVNEY